MATITSQTAQKLQLTGQAILRYGLVLILLGIGFMKFFEFEAKGISLFISASPLMSWMYKVFSVRGASNVIGVYEVLAGVLIALRNFSPRLSALGSLMAIPMFLTTLTFMVTTPGGMDPASLVSGFLIKDLILLGASVWTAGEALTLSVCRSKLSEACHVQRESLPRPA